MTQDETDRAAAGTRFARSWRLLLAIAFVGIAISIGAFFFARKSDDARVRSELELRAEWRVRDMDRKLSLAVEDVGALAALMATQDNIDAASFRRYALLEHGVADSYSTLLWAPLVKAQDRDAFVAAARQKAGADYEITERGANGQLTPARGREAYMPILYAVDFEPRVQGTGVDVLARANRRRTLDLARDAGVPIATPPIRIVSSLDQALGFIVFWPVYTTGDLPLTVTQRRATFRGAIVAIFTFDKVFPAAIAGTPEIAEAIDFSIDRGAAGEGSVHVAHFDPATQGFSIDETTPAVEPGSISLTRDFSVLGRRWTLVSHFSPAFIAESRSSGPWAWLGFGLLLMTLSMAAAERERWRRTGVEALVEERTATLAATNRTLSQEIEERRQAQEKSERSQALLNATFNSAPFAIVVRDTDFRIVLWNRAAEQISGWTAAEVIGQPEVGQEGGPEARFQALAQRIIAGGTIREGEQERRRKDGSVFRIRRTVAPIYIGSALSGFVSLVEDVTQRAAMERQLVQAQKMEAVGSQTGGLAHDFNNLLGVIIGNLDLLHPLLKSAAEAEELAVEALDASLRGADLTQRLLAFARRQPLQPQLVNLNELVLNASKLFGRLLDANIRLVLQLASEVWPVVVDPVQLESSLMNLITNARDVMPRGGTVAISTDNRQLDADYGATHAEVVPGDYVMIEVSDTGAGMTPEVASHIFEPFFTTKETGKGTGLGLSMVFGFMKQSGGHINVYSEVGAGTTFRLYLPRNGNAAPSLARKTEAPPVSARGETVLVVEDNAKLRRVVMRQIAELGYRAVEAEDAAAALPLLENGKVDLLFTDIVMPGGIDGFELARRAIETRPDLKVVLTSGFPGAKINGDLGTFARAAQLLTKPYRKDELAQALREALDAAVSKAQDQEKIRSKIYGARPGHRR